MLTLFFLLFNITTMSKTNKTELIKALIVKHSNEQKKLNFKSLIDEIKNLSLKDKVALSGMGEILNITCAMPKHILEKKMKAQNEMATLDLNFKANVSDNPLLDAFPEKTFPHTSGGMSIVPPPMLPIASEVLSHIPRTTRSVAYINVPFCQTRCSFCMFYIAPYKKEESKRFADAVIKEIAMWDGLESQSSRKIQALYLGGGTPTALEACDLYRIIKSAKDYLPLANDVEITVEGRVSYFDEEKIEACLKAGANRFSLGVQTFDTKCRQALGRISTQDELISHLSKLTSYDEAAVVIDLIFGLPNQSLDSFEKDLKIALDLNLSGLDLYQLIMLEHSPLEKIKKANPNLKMPDKQDRARLYEFGCNFLERNHLRQLSISHFARSTKERNLYNVLAKSDADTLAFGPGAGGKIQGLSFLNKRTYEDYLKDIEQNKKPIAMMFMPSRYFSLYKDLGEMLELGYIDRKAIFKKHNLDIMNLASEVFEQWQEAKLLTIDERYINLNLAGLFYSVTMSQLLQNYLIHKLEPRNS